MNAPGSGGKRRRGERGGATIAQQVAAQLSTCPPGTDVTASTFHVTGRRNSVTRALLALVRRGNILHAGHGHYRTLDAAQARPGTVTGQAPAALSWRPGSLRGRVLRHLQTGVAHGQTFTRDDLAHLGGRRELTVLLSQLTAAGELLRPAKQRYLRAPDVAGLTLSVTARVRAYLDTRSAGDLITRHDMASLAAPGALNVALHRLVRNGRLRRQRAGEYLLSPQ